MRQPWQGEGMTEGPDGTGAADELAARRARRLTGAHSAGPRPAATLDELLGAAGSAVRDPALLSDEDDTHLDALADHTLQRLDDLRPARSPVLRGVLAAVAVIQLVLSVPWLVGSNPWSSVLGDVPSSHLTRDGAIGVAAATAGLLTAWRTRYALAMLAVAGVSLAMQVLGGAVDSAVASDFEVVHAIALLIVVLVFAVAMRRERAPGPGAVDPRRR